MESAAPGRVQHPRTQGDGDLGSDEIERRNVLAEHPLHLHEQALALRRILRLHLLPHQVVDPRLPRRRRLRLTGFQK